MIHSATVAIRRRLTPRHVSVGRWMPVLLSALALVTGGPAALALTATTTTLATNPAPPTTPASGTVITLKATVKATASVTGGTVTFSDKFNNVTEVLGTVQVQTNGTATLRTGVGGVGAHQFEATFGGTSTYQGSSSAQVSLTFAGKYPTATALSYTGTGPYMFTGIVSAFGPAAPGGSVTFTDTTTNKNLGTVNVSDTSTGFTPNQSYPIANMNNGYTGGTIGPAIGDFNNDGIADYAVPTNGGANGGGPIVILLGKGDGTFTTGTPIATAAGFTPSSAVVGDFDGDGNQDLAVLSASGTGLVNIYLGRGNGNFRTAKNYQFPVAAAASASRLLAIGDFNRDGIQDLVASNSSLNQVAVILGNGDGTFGAPSYFPVQTAPWNIAVGDLNHDGFLDLAVAADASGSVSILEGKGDGTFQPYTTAPTYASQVGSVAIGDFNGDGWPDLAFTSAPDNAVYVLLNQKDATPTFDTGTVYPMDSDPYYLTIGDFNRDGYPDIISANNGNNNVGVLLNNGASGTAGTFGTASYYGVGGGSIFANAADINGDDQVDLTAVTGYGLSVLLSGETATASESNIALNPCGQHTVTAAYSGDTTNNYAASTSAAQTVAFTRLATTLSLTIAPTPVVVGQQSSVTATLSPYNYGTASSNGELVTFTDFGNNVFTAPLINGVATVNVTPNANQFGNGTYSGQAKYNGDACLAGSVSNTVNGNILLPSTLTWATPAPIAYGTALSSVQLNASDNAPGGGTYAYTPAAGTVLPVGTSTLSVTFTPYSATFAPETKTVQIVVSKGPFIIWPTPNPITYGTPLTNYQLDATASNGVIPVPLDNYYNVYGIYDPGSIYTTNGFDGDGYSYSSSTLGSTLVWNGMTFNIGPADQPDAVSNETIPLPSGQYSTLYMLGAMVNNINPPTVTFVVNYTDGSTTTYTQNMSDWYNAAGWSGESVISCSENRNYSDGKTASTQADSVCVYGYQIALDATKTVKSVQLPGTRNIVMLSMNLATPSIPGTFVYTPAAGAIEPVGTDTLSVTFTPTDTTTYKPVTATVQLVVDPPVNFKTPTSISWPTPAPITYGTPLSSTQLDALAMGAPRPTQVPLNNSFVVAMSTDGTPFNQSGFDGAGNAYSYNSLNNGSINYAGTTFILGKPNVADAITNGAVDTLSTPGNYSAVYLLGAATTSTAQTNQPFTLTYSDGTTSTALLNMSSWTSPAGYADETIVAATKYANTQSGGKNSGNGVFDLYGYQIPADPTRTLVSITLPKSQICPSGQQQCIGNVVILAVGVDTYNDVVVPGNYVYTIPSNTPGGNPTTIQNGTILPAGTYTVTVTFTPTDPAGYTSATGTTTLVVNKATPIINWPTPAPSFAPAILTGVQLDATANVQGTFAYTPAAFPQSGAFSQGVYTLSTVFTPTGPNAGNYTQASASVQWVVGLGTTGISGNASYTTCCFFSQPTPYTVTVTGLTAPAGTVQVLNSKGAQLASGTLTQASTYTSTVNLQLNSDLLIPGSNTVTLNFVPQAFNPPSRNPNNASTSKATVNLLSPAIPVTDAGLSQTTITLVPYTFAQRGQITSYSFNPNTEFKNAPAGTTNTACQAGVTYAAGYTCDFAVAFTPLLPGVRKGTMAVNFTPSQAPPAPLPNPEPTLTLFFSGMGESAQIALSSAIQSQLGTSSTQFQALAFNPTDAYNSTLYVANSSATPGQIDQLSSTGGSLTQWNAANTGSLKYPADLSFDAFDNYIVADYYGGNVYEYSSSTLKQSTVTLTPALAPVQPTQARVDLGGNLYIADTNSNNTSRIIQVPEEAYVANQLPAAGLTFAQALAVDNLGAYLYVGDGGYYSPTLIDPPQIVRFALGANGAETTASQFNIGPCASKVSCTLTSPAAFAFDLNNDMYVLDSTSNVNSSGARILMVPNGHNSANPTTQLAMTGLISPTAITLDAAGNIYVADVEAVDKLSVNSGAMVFTNTTTSTTTVTNTGDLPLIIYSITLGNGTKSSFTESDNCVNVHVAPGASCTITVNYAKPNQGFDTLTLMSNSYSPTGVTIQLTY